MSKTQKKGLTSPDELRKLLAAGRMLHQLERTRKATAIVTFTDGPQVEMTIDDALPFFLPLSLQKKGPSGNTYIVTP